MFKFVLASLTYHGDFIVDWKFETNILLNILPKGMSIEEGRKQAVALYESFYNYSDAKFDVSI